jgi:hypothetical protein
MTEEKKYEREHTITHEKDFINNLGGHRPPDIRTPDYCSRSYAWWLRQYTKAAALAEGFLTESWRVEAYAYAKKRLEREIKWDKKADDPEYRKHREKMKGAG